MKLLYYSPISYGGLADYAHEQANALVSIGVDVTLLCTPKYSMGRKIKYKVLPILQEHTPPKPLIHKSLKLIYFIIATLSNFAKLANVITQQKFQYVLFGSYSEYLAPLWSRPLRQLAKKGVIFGAVVHDPVRDFVVGPYWWHRWSIACGYSFMQEAFVHEAIALDTVKPMPNLQTTIIPHGCYQFLPPQKSQEQVRAEFNIPQEAKVLLSFGHIRDNKNLDLALKAIAHFPNVYLVVAGKVASSTQRPITYYQDLALSLGVAERCRWLINFIPEEQVGDLFNASDAVLLTYSASFQSASGVLNAAVAYRRSCIASAGLSNLRAVVQKYNLGIFVEPDNWKAICDGIHLWLNDTVKPNWKDYKRDNSWEKNAEIVCRQFWKPQL